MIIYKLTNKVTGKVYVGKTKRSLKDRVKGHEWYAENGKPTKLTNSINKHGIGKFTAEVLEEVRDSNLLDSRERFWIKYFNSQEDGLNSTPGGDGGDNSEYINYSSRKSIYNDELREVRRQQLLKNNPNYMPGVRDKIRQSKLGHKKSKEWISKIVDSKKANGWTWKGTSNPNYVEVTKEQEKLILDNFDKVDKKKELVNMTNLSYFMVNKVLKKHGLF